MFSSRYSLHKIPVLHVLTLKAEQYSQNKALFLLSSEPRTQIPMYRGLLRPQKSIPKIINWSNSFSVLCYKRIFHFEYETRSSLKRYSSSLESPRSIFYSEIELIVNYAFGFCLLNTITILMCKSTFNT